MSDIDIEEIDIKDERKLKDVKALYQQVFKESKEFTDYFFEYEIKKICDDRPQVTVLGGYMKEKIVTEMFLIRKKLHYKKKEIEGIYIYGVATDFNYRNKGYMTKLMKYAIKIAKKEKKLLYLIPVDERIYERFGFRVVKNADRPEKFSRAELMEYDIITENSDENVFSEMEKFSEQSEEKLDYVFIKKDKEYYKSRMYEAAADEGFLCIKRNTEGDIEKIIYQNNDVGNVTVMVRTRKRSILKKKFYILDLV